jgi:hypothetical protein
MSTQATNDAAKIRQARHAGFLNSTLHIPDAERNAVYDRYKTQDSRREKNINGFVTQIRGGK